MSKQIKKNTNNKLNSYKVTTKKVIPKVTSDMIASVVKDQVTKIAEKKTAAFAGVVNVSAYTNITNLYTNIIPVTPYAVSGITINQGSGQGDRQSNRIRVTSSWIRGCIYPNPYNATTNPYPCPQEVRVWFFSAKDYNTQPTSLPLFFQSGDTSLAPQGNLLDMMRNVNTDAYNYYGMRTYKVGHSSYGGTGNQPGFQSFANNDFKYNIKFNINCTKFLPKNIKFNDTNATPFSRNVFMYWECVDADGANQTAAEMQLQMYYVNTIKYTDF